MLESNDLVVQSVLPFQQSYGKDLPVMFDAIFYC